MKRKALAEITGHDGETYITRDEACKRFEMNEAAFYAYLTKDIKSYRFPAVSGNRAYYKLRELEANRLTPRQAMPHPTTVVSAAE